MAFEPIPDAWRVAMLFDSETTLHPWVLTFGVLDTDPHTNARAVDVATGFASWWAGHLAAVVSQHSFIAAIRVQDQADEFGVSIFYSSGFPDSGGHTGDPAPLQCAAITTLLTGVRGRSNRGRSYLGALAASDVNAADGTLLDGTARSAIQTAYVNLPGSITGAASGAELAVLSFKE